MAKKLMTRNVGVNGRPLRLRLTPSTEKIG
ncbi:hypothetical protein B840_12635 (plasmid) [Corynebacterium marinum DSM 44953]|uniref:Uncharacterized protein n=1 Tax=Corynebacterium marinum DSM 44953 TaxID=1224162 RepID=A0A0B6TWX9_9CORY|nr:hypothetical protein B840_12635 [Corynebacterium marinum DSM 44953]